MSSRVDLGGPTLGGAVSDGFALDGAVSDGPDPGGLSLHGTVSDGLDPGGSVLGGHAAHRPEPGVGVAGEHLIAAFPTRPGERATDAFFHEAPLTLERLGDAMLGRPNRQDATLTEATALAELLDFRAAGGTLLVELTRAQHGADHAALARLSATTGVQIVAAAHADEGPLAPRLGPGLAGVIVLGPDTEPTAQAEALALAAEKGVPLMLSAEWRGEAQSLADDSFRAVEGGAPAQRRATTDVKAPKAEPANEAPLDPSPHSRLDSVLDRVSAAGVAPGQIAFLGARALAHQHAVLIALAERGVYLHFSDLGRIPSVYTEVSDHDVALALAALTAAGHGQRLLIATGVDRRHTLHEFGGHGLGFVARQFLPYLGFMGLGAEASEDLATHNLVRFLDWKRP